MLDQATFIQWTKGDSNAQKSLRNGNPNIAHDRYHSRVSANVDDVANATMGFVVFWFSIPFLGSGRSH
jgi:hypothetical protein